MTTRPDTPSKAMGYLLWLFGFTGSHRFYYGKPITGTIWFFTFGLGILYDYWTLNEQISRRNSV